MKIAHRRNKAPGALASRLLSDHGCPVGKLHFAIRNLHFSSSFPTFLLRARRLRSIEPVRQEILHRQRQQHQDHEPRQKLDRLSPAVLYGFTKIGALVHGDDRAGAEQLLDLLGGNAGEQRFLGRNVDAELGRQPVFLIDDLVGSRSDSLPSSFRRVKMAWAPMSPGPRSV